MARNEVNYELGFFLCKRDMSRLAELRGEQESLANSCLRQMGIELLTVAATAFISERSKYQGDYAARLCLKVIR